MTYAAITGWGKCMPPAVLDNAGLASFMDTSDEWITSRTGIRERRVSHVPMTVLSHVAAMRALACAGMDPKDIDLVVLGTCSADETVPNTASAIQLLIGATKAAAMDINTACTSFLYGLSTATAMIRTGVVRMRWWSEWKASRLIWIGAIATSRCCSATELQRSSCRRPIRKKA